jgi:hypothetical protein
MIIVGHQIELTSEIPRDHRNMFNCSSLYRTKNEFTPFEIPKFVLQTICLAKGNMTGPWLAARSCLPRSQVFTARKRTEYANNGLTTNGKNYL